MCTIHININMVRGHSIDHMKFVIREFHNTRFAPGRQKLLFYLKCSKVDKLHCWIIASVNLQKNVMIV